MQIETVLKGTEPDDKNIVSFDLKDGSDCSSNKKMFMCEDLRDPNVLIFITFSNEELKGLV